MTKDKTNIYTTEDLRNILFGTAAPNGPSPPAMARDPTVPDDSALPPADSPTCELDTERIVPKTPTALPVPDTPHDKVLDRYDMVDELDEIKRLNVDAFYVLNLLAQKGRWTVIYAPPNVGKTLLVMAFLTKTIQKYPGIAKSIYYVNADDNVDGVIDKGAVAAEWGFFMLVPGYKEFNIRDLQTLLIQVGKSGQAHQTIVIIDTLKKAVDLMKKSQLRAFGDCIRQFVSQGGTFITLAHTNKNVGPDGKPIPEGTADIINDADCAYLLYEIDRDERAKTVMLECRKSRGGDLQEVFIRYSTEPNLSYQELLSTVEQVDGSELQEFKPVPQPTAEDVIVGAICRSISEGINTKMRIRDYAAELTGASKREVLRIVEQYTGNDPAQHQWSFTRGERGRQQFQLLTPSRNSVSADFQISTPAENNTETTTTEEGNGNEYL